MPATNSLSVEQDEIKMEWIPQPGRANYSLRLEYAAMLVAPLGEWRLWNDA